MFCPTFLPQGKKNSPDRKVLIKSTKIVINMIKYIVFTVGGYWQEVGVGFSFFEGAAH